MQNVLKQLWLWLSLAQVLLYIFISLGESKLIPPERLAECAILC